MGESSVSDVPATVPVALAFIGLPAMMRTLSPSSRADSVALVKANEPTLAENRTSPALPGAVPLLLQEHMATAMSSGIIVNAFVFKAGMNYLLYASLPTLYQISLLSE